MINNIRKRIRIEGGRAYAVDPWLHLFVLKIEPLMVVSKNWRRTGPGQYTGEDLPLVGQFRAQLDASGNMTVQVAGMLGPATLTLSPVRPDSQRRFEREKRAIGGISPEPDYADDEYEASPSDEEEYEEEASYEEDDSYADDDSYEDDTYEADDSSDAEYDDVYAEDGYEQIEYEEADYEVKPKKKAAIKVSKAKNGCKGKQIYLSGGSCYACPSDYRRFSPTRKMTHAEACTERGFGQDTRPAKYLWEANGCQKGLFKHNGYCKVCPEGTKRMHAAGLDTGYCKVI